MKTSLLLFLCTFSIYVTIFAQQYKYVPFPTHNAIWVEHHTAEYGSTNDSSYFYCYGLKNNDTIINGFTYHKLYFSFDTILRESEAIGGIREDSNKRVYMWYFKCTSFGYTEVCNMDRVLYDFSLKIGDSIKAPRDTIMSTPEYILSHPLSQILMKIDTVLLGSELRKRFFFGPSLTHGYLPWGIWIEGIGYMRGLLYPTGDFPANGLWNDLVCFWQDGKEVYHYDYYPKCFDYLISAVESETIGKNVMITPNPMTNECTFSFSERYNQQRLEIYDLYGKLKFYAFIINRKAYTFNNRGILKPGLYLFRVTGIGKNVFRGKLMVN
jgi:hypothetical protein